MKSLLRQGIEEIHGDTLDADFIEACALLKESAIILESASQDVIEILGEIDN